MKQIVDAAKARAGHVPVQWATMKKWNPRRLTGPDIMWTGGDALISDTAKVTGNFSIGEGSALSIGDNAIVSGSKFIVEGAGSAIIIGPNCRLQNVRMAVRSDNSLVVIGKGTTWESGKLVCTEGRMITTGFDCMFSNDVLMRTSDGHGIFDVNGMLLNRSADVQIGDHVWLGNGARVNKGTRIADCVIVGQGAIASGNLDRWHHIYAGIPARPVKGPVNWGRRNTWDSVPERFRYREGGSEGRDFPLKLLLATS